MPGILIDMSIEQVGEAVSDLTRHTEWSAHSKTEALQEDPPSVGSKYASYPPGSEVPDQITITEFSPNSRITFRSMAARDMQFDFAMTLEARGDATYLTRDAVLAEGPFILKPLKLLISPRREMGAVIKVIKEALEGG